MIDCICRRHAPNPDCPKHGIPGLRSLGDHARKPGPLDTPEGRAADNDRFQRAKETEEAARAR